MIGRHTATAIVRPLRPFHWREAALCVPAMPLILVAAVLLHHPVQGAIAAGSAFAVGFGAARELRGRRWAAMGVALIGMVIAAFAGTLLGQNSMGFVVVAAIGSAGVAALALYDEDAWWVALQVAIIFFVAGYYEGPLAAATLRAEWVLFGGAVQMAIVWLLAHLFPSAGAPIFDVVRPDTVDRRLLVAHAVRAALCVAGSLSLIAPLGLAYGYWAPMTALIVLKPRLMETRSRGVARIAGTLAGCLVATLFALACGERGVLLVIGAGIAAGAAYALQKAHYASLTLSITATVVLLVSIGTANPIANAEHRLIATLVGGVLALIVATVIPHRAPRLWGSADRVGGREAAPL